MHRRPQRRHHDHRRLGQLGGHGVDVHPIVRGGVSSRAIAALIAPSGDRSMVSDLASATALHVDDIDSAWFDDPTQAATQLLDVAETVAVTCGADVASRRRGAFHAPASAVEVVNTLGAGDVFAAGFIAARVAGREDEASTKAGLVAAAHAVTRATAR